MKVTLISYTRDAIDLLLFAKSTRLEMNPELMDDIRQRPITDKINELVYIANSIPSCWEFVDYVFLVEGVSRAYTHQQVRTRTGSYAQQSLRTVDMSAGFDFIWPELWKNNPYTIEYVGECLSKIKETYAQLCKNGYPIEYCRALLPTNVSTNIVCKFNLRTFSDLVKSRSGGRVQDEYRQVVKAMVDEVLRAHPWAENFIFDDKRNYFDEIEEFAAKEFENDPIPKNELLKIVDKMRKEM